MRLGKQEGIAVRCYRESGSQAAMRRLELVQPKLDLSTLTPIGCEALLRWLANW